MRSWRWMLRDIRQQKSFTLLFVLSLSLGLCGFSALEIFKQSLDRTLLSQSKTLMGADLSLNARRPISDEEIAIVEQKVPGVQFAKGIEMFSMISDQGSRSLLAQIKTLESPFPFYGEIEKDTESPLQPGQVWVYPEILIQLGLEKNQKIQIGQKEFLIHALVHKDPGAGFSTSMAPRIYMLPEDLEKTELLKPGSLSSHAVFFKLPENFQGPIEKLREEIFEKMQAPDLRVQTHENASEQIGRLIRYLNDFLGLTSIVGLLLSCIGLSFLSHSFLRQKRREMAVLISLGLSTQKTLWQVGLHLSTLGLIGSGLAALFALVILPFLQKLSQQLLPVDLEIYVHWPSLLVALFLGLLTSLASVLPFLWPLRRLKPQELFSPIPFQNQKWTWTEKFLFLPALILFLSLCLLQTQSAKVGLLFFAAFVGSALVFFIMSFLLLTLVGKCRPTRPLFLSWALRDLSRFRALSVTAFMSLGLGLLMMNVIPQVQATLQEELQAPDQSKLPSLFLFDIQEEQVEGLKSLLQKEKVPLNDLSPMIRARLISVNGEVFDKGSGTQNKKSYQESQEASFRNRGFNLSFRESLSESETLVEGRNFQTSQDSEVAELSIEQAFAQRLNLKINDVMEFDIQGIPVRGKIVNFRKVKWTSFQPNFFVIFQPGFLEDAPKTYLATLPRKASAEKVALQNKIVQEFGNISMVDVARTLERILDIMKQMSQALQWMALLNVLVGLVVLYSLVLHQARERRRDIGLFKAVGTPYSLIRRHLMLQFVLISVAAGILGVLGSLLISYVLSQVLFENRWVFELQWPMTLLIGAWLSASAITYLALNRQLKTKPQSLLS